MHVFLQLLPILWKETTQKTILFRPKIFVPKIVLKYLLKLWFATSGTQNHDSLYRMEQVYSIFGEFSFPPLETQRKRLMILFGLVTKMAPSRLQRANLQTKTNLSALIDVRHNICYLSSKNTFKKHVPVHVMQTYMYVYPCVYIYSYMYIYIIYCYIPLHYDNQYQTVGLRALTLVCNMG